MDAIMGDVLTKERMARRDVRIEEGDRGGVKFYVPSYLDVLMDNDVITKTHRAHGLIYWSLRDAAMSFLATKANPLFADVTGENSEYEQSPEYEDGTPIELFFCLKLKPDDKSVIDACCTKVEGNAMAIVWAYGVNKIVWAFDALEREIPEARERLKLRLQENVFY